MKLNRRCLPIFFHNLRGYDGHLLCEAAFAKKLNWELSVIPQTKEKYLGMTAKFQVDQYKGKKDESVPLKFSLQFKDSAQFLCDSLDSLVRNLKVDQLVYSKQAIPTNAPTSLINAKGIFPYEWFDGVEKLEWRSLPSQDLFYDK